MIKVETEYPIAVDSPDHTHPFGTMRDNSVNVEFNCKLAALLGSPKDIRLLDLGCAGGGLVQSILDDGGMAVGIEGSDYSRECGRAAWPVLDGRNLFTVDVSRIFSINQVRSSIDHRMLFNVVTAWEFFEHIAEDRISTVMHNVKVHLDTDGFLIGSINTQSSLSDGVEYHQTIRPEGWWVDRFAVLGWKRDHNLEIYFGIDVVRGPNVPGSFVIVLRPL